MKAQFVSLAWQKGTPKYLVQGVKGNNRPRRALYGGNGSFMVMGTPAKLTLFVRTTDNKLFEMNILPNILSALNRFRMSEKLYNTIEEICKQITFDVLSNEEIDISPIINQLTKKEL